MYHQYVRNVIFNHIVNWDCLERKFVSSCHLYSIYLVSREYDLLISDYNLLRYFKKLHPALEFVPEVINKERNLKLDIVRQSWQHATAR